MAIKFSDIQKNDLVQIEKFGIFLEFELTQKIVDMVVESQERQQKKLIHILDKKGEINFKNVKTEDIDAILFKKGNPFEKVIYSIEGVEENALKAHFEKFGATGSLKYSQFVNYVYEQITKKINEDNKPR